MVTLGKTKDDAIGEAFDKVARVMNLTYPGGPKIDAMAKLGKPSISLPKTHLDGLNFSFSGIKTAVININHNQKDIKKEDLCASFEEAVTSMLLNNTEKAIKEYGFKKLALARWCFGKFIYKRKVFRDWKEARCRGIFSKPWALYR